MKLFEIFDKSIEYSWETKSEDHWRAIFHVNDEEYFIDCSYEDVGWSSDFWELSFGPTSDYFAGTKVIGTKGKEFLIFSTVLKAFEEFISQVHPERICISASKDNENRIGLYRKIANKVSNKLKSYGFYPDDSPKYDILDVNKYFDRICFSK